MNETAASTTFSRLAAVATVLALCVVVLGAYVRLSDAGLGCPDWPGCYGHVGVPESGQEVAAANAAYPERPVEAGKAWKEMVHRYLAGTLGLLILALAIVAWRHRRRQPVWLPTLLVGLVGFQALLGMWTVTLLLKPVVVMGHLLGGLMTLSLLWWLALRRAGVASRQGVGPSPAAGRYLRPWALLGLALLVLQLALGGWTSANYAALACPDFPTCQGAWWPPTDFGEAFILWRGLGIDYEGGVLDHPARVTIHLMHRMGAVVTFLYLGWLAIGTIRARGGQALTVAGAALLLVLLVQVSLGIGNVLLVLPLPVAVAHNGVGALLLLTLVTVLHYLNPPRQRN